MEGATPTEAMDYETSQIENGNVSSSNLPSRQTPVVRSDGEDTGHSSSGDGGLVFSDKQGTSPDVVHSSISQATESLVQNSSHRVHRVGKRPTFAAPDEVALADESELPSKRVSLSNVSGYSTSTDSESADGKVGTPAALMQSRTPSSSSQTSGMDSNVHSPPNATRTPTEPDTHPKVFNTLFIRNVPDWVTRTMLKATFGKYGEILSTNKYSGQGWGWVNFKWEDEAVAAKEKLQHSEIFEGAGPSPIDFARPWRNAPGEGDGHSPRQQRLEPKDHREEQIQREARLAQIRQQPNWREPRDVEAQVRGVGHRPGPHASHKQAAAVDQRPRAAHQHENADMNEYQELMGKLDKLHALLERYERWGNIEIKELQRKIAELEQDHVATRGVETRLRRMEELLGPPPDASTRTMEERLEVMEEAVDELFSYTNCLAC
ncbi:uncharacterized protein BCR38DRAFT_408448 [Pseudomassariella vexata]|uniref:RRM domain-containing protein n=1 Tax=Pseudomassariella vexata TaxID=1141098 RepID=A0A1Y2E4N8_9PEZI|nr:uncharacterized protein BCR38DRAFT_408448 [Pseudomassariella vexata]ORY66523.1 hypothetical protein BCR38DRAFT_408448 [Pseudomassariella vexata]